MYIHPYERIHAHHIFNERQSMKLLFPKPYNLNYRDSYFFPFEKKNPFNEIAIF